MRSYKMDLNNSTVKHVKKITVPEGTPAPLDAIFVTPNGSDTVYAVPVSEGNSDYQAILAWVAEGNTPEPADE